MNCKFHHKSTAREYRTQKLTEKSRLNHEGHEDYYKNIRTLRVLLELRGKV